MEFRKLWKAFFFLFLTIFLVINWNQISWIFNYRTVSTLFSDLLSSKKEERQVKDIFLDENEVDFYDKENSLKIPKIDLLAPIIFLEDSQADKVNEALDGGAVLFPNSALPGQEGQSIILGHSAPLGWPKIKYDWIFSRLNELIEEDKIVVFFDNRKYEYSVVRKVFLEKGEEISKDNLTNDRNMLVLISCWPPGKDIRRIAVEAELID